MPRKSFFEELRKQYITAECKQDRHEECGLEVIIGDPTDFPVHQKPCGCICHDRGIGPTKVFTSEREE
jgi:hypothetical protein